MDRSEKANPDASIPFAKMRALLDLSRQMAVTADLDHLLPLICRSTIAMLGADRSSLYLYDGKANQLWTKVALGMEGQKSADGSPVLSEIRIPATAGIAGLVFQTREMLVIPDAYADPRFNRAVDLRTGYRTRNLLTLPVFDLAGAAVAVLQVINKSPESGNAEGAFTATDEMLARLLADQAGVAIQRFHLQQKALEGVLMQKEMDLARRVQEGLLPKSPPKVPGLCAGGWNRPASTTGGDAYDLWETKDGRLAVFVADATGHGIAPALVVSQARALVRVLADERRGAGWGEAGTAAGAGWIEPAEILAKVNERLSADLDAGMFVTAFLGLISPDGELRWCSAGHGPVLVRRRGGEVIEELMPPAPPLGVLPDFLPDDAPPVQLDAGGWLAVVTDGVTESFSPERDQFGSERLIVCLEKDACSGPVKLIESLRNCLSDWQREREPSDDQTVVLVVRE